MIALKIIWILIKPFLYLALGLYIMGFVFSFAGLIFLPAIITGDFTGWIKVLIYSYYFIDILLIIGYFIDELNG